MSLKIAGDIQRRVRRMATEFFAFIVGHRLDLDLKENHHLDDRLYFQNSRF
jgi:hypothetical protein